MTSVATVVHLLKQHSPNSVSVVKFKLDIIHCSAILLRTLKRLESIRIMSTQSTSDHVGQGPGKTVLAPVRLLPSTVRLVNKETGDTEDFIDVEIPVAPNSEFFYHPSAKTEVEAIPEKDLVEEYMTKVAFRGWKLLPFGSEARSEGNNKRYSTILDTSSLEGGLAGNSIAARGDLTLLKAGTFEAPAEGPGMVPASGEPCCNPYASGCSDINTALMSLPSNRDDEVDRGTYLIPDSSSNNLRVALQPWEWRCCITSCTNNGESSVKDS